MFSLPLHKQHSLTVFGLYRAAEQEHVDDMPSQAALDAEWKRIQKKTFTRSETQAEDVALAFI